MLHFVPSHLNYVPVKLPAAVCKLNGWIPNLVRFYTGVPNLERAPMWTRYWAKRLLYMKNAGISVTTRPLRYREETVTDAFGNTAVVFTPREKGIDVRLALDIVSTARTQQWSVAVIFSQDQDLAEVVQEVLSIAKEQQRWIEICCAFPDGPNATSRRGIDKTTWCRMDEEFYGACIDPTDYRPRP